MSVWYCEETNEIRVFWFEAKKDDILNLEDVQYTNLKSKVLGFKWYYIGEL